MEKPWFESGWYKLSEKIYNENQKFFLDFLIPGQQDARLLDLGCMNGKFTEKIAEVVGTQKKFGIEIEKSHVKDATKKGIKVKSSDLNKRFPFKSGQFDVLTANQVLEHVWNTHNFFKETNRVLKKGGYAVISTPNLSSFHSIFFILQGKQPPVVHLVGQQVGNRFKGVIVSVPEHMKAFNIPALRDLAEIYGFEVERLEGYGIYYVPIFLQRLASRIFGRYAVFLTMRMRKTKNYKERSGHR
jgi:SAM-dependent methyltransferase